MKMKLELMSGTISPRLMEINRLLMELEHCYVRTNSIQLHVVQAGPKSGVPVMLLHGFPVFWYG